MRVHATVLATALLAAPALAQRPTKADRARETERLAKGAKRVERDCGCKVELKIDFDGFPDNTQLLGAGSVGDAFADAAKRQCETRGGRKALCSTVKRFVVGYEACPPGATPTPPKLADGALRSVRCVGTGVSESALWSLFEKDLPTPDEPLGDAPGDADAAVKTTPELAVAKGTPMYPDGAAMADKEAIRSRWKDVAEAADKVVANCRARPAASVDWPSFQGPHLADGPMICERALSALAFSCSTWGSGDDQLDFAPTVRAKVKGVRCHLDPKLGPDANGRVLPSFAFKDGVFEVWVNWGSDNWLYGAIDTDGGRWLREKL